MSFLDDALGTVLGGSTGGLLAHFWGDLNSRPGVSSTPITPPMQASSVPLIDQLRDPLNAINKKRQAALQDSLTTLGNRATTSAKASGRVVGSYAPTQLGIAGKQASSGIEDSLLGQLGGASYDKLKKQQEQERNLALAKEIGSLSAPSILEQVLGGLSGGARAGGQFYSLYNALGRNGGGGGGSLGPSLSLFDPNASGYARYS